MSKMYSLAEAAKKTFATSTAGLSMYWAVNIRDARCEADEIESESERGV